jgi:hypothetical protein
MYSYFQLVMLHERIADMARLAERRHVAEEQESKAGGLERRRESKRRDPTPGQSASWAGSVGDSG